MAKQRSFIVAMQVVLSDANDGLAPYIKPLASVSANDVKNLLSDAMQDAYSDNAEDPTRPAFDASVLRVIEAGYVSSCAHRCRDGRHCGGCGCPGCGYS